MKSHLNLAYAASTLKKPFINFGDGLSAVVLALLTQKRIIRANFDSESHRISAIGTILHSFNNGYVDVWGSGLDSRIGQGSEFYVGPKNPHTILKLHAVRGRFTASHLSCLGYSDPGRYGDPAILIKLFLKDGLEIHENKRKVGLVCHFTEFEAYSPTSTPKLDRQRYHNLDPAEFVVINPLVMPNAVSVINKVKEIASYGFIISTSLHGLIIADAFGIPCAMLGSENIRPGCLCNFDPSSPIDHRFRDYHSGLSIPWTPVFSVPYNEQLDYTGCVNFLTSLPSKALQIDCSIDMLLNSFPLEFSLYTNEHWGPLESLIPLV